MTDQEMRIEYLPLSKIVRAPRNAKDHDAGAIQRSIDRFGYAAPMMLNEATERLVAGHGRLDLLQGMKAAGKPAPHRVKVSGSEWLVPVIRGISFATDAEAEAYLVADNRTVELGGWHEDVSVQVLSDLAAAGGGLLEATGYDAQDLDAMIASVNASVEDSKAKEASSSEASPIRQLVLYLEGQQYDDVVARLRYVMDRTMAANHTEAFLRTLDAWELAAAGKPAIEDPE